MALLASGALVAATVTTGLTAGLLYAFAHAVMPGLGRADDRTFVGAFQAVDRVIVNPWFIAGFLGAPVFIGLAALLHLAPDRRAALPWVLAALLLYLVVFVITMAVNVPLNNQLHAAGDPDQAGDLAAARERFEARWVRWNVVRTIAAVAAFAALAVALAVGP